MTTAKPLLTKEDVERYGGQWVLLRRRQIVFASKKIEEVRAARKERFDAIARVPEQLEVFY